MTTPIIEWRAGTCAELTAESHPAKDRPLLQIHRCEKACQVAEHWHTRQGETYRCDVVGYCLEHGGLARAQEEAAHRAEHCWDTHAPAHLTREHVESAGIMALQSQHAYVVVRATEGSRWKAAIGLGSHTEELIGSWETARQAERAALHAWRRELDARVRRIEIARGGSLDWGLSVQPLATPRVIRFDGLSGNAWEQTAHVAAPTPGIEDEPVRLGLNTKERQILAHARGGDLLPDSRPKLASLIARARNEGLPFSDEADLRRVAEAE